jgi:hypothetical protein
VQPERAGTGTKSSASTRTLASRERTVTQIRFLKREEEEEEGLFKAKR